MLGGDGLGSCARALSRREDLDGTAGAPGASADARWIWTRGGPSETSGWGQGQGCTPGVLSGRIGSLLHEGWGADPPGWCQIRLWIS